MTNLSLSPNGLNLIKKSESCRLHVYLDSAGKKTIGWGHLIRPFEKIGDIITQERADELLIEDINERVGALNKFCDKFSIDLNVNQFDSLVDFIYNEGFGAFEGSTLAKHIKFEEFDKAALEFEKWDYADGKQSTGLLARRQREKALFLTPVNGNV